MNGSKIIDPAELDGVIFMGKASGFPLLSNAHGITYHVTFFRTMRNNYFCFVLKKYAHTTNRRSFAAAPV